MRCFEVGIPEEAHVFTSRGSKIWGFLTSKQLNRRIYNWSMLNIRRELNNEINYQKNFMSNFVRFKKSQQNILITNKHVS